MEHITNCIVLHGQLQDIPQFSHENHGRRFFRFCLEVSRLSGAVDILPVVAEEQLLSELDLCPGESYTVTGQIRSHNLRDNDGRHLLIFIFATSLTTEDGPPTNDVQIEGILCRDPTYRRTPLGR